MGVDYNSKLIFGYQLDSDIVDKWLVKNNIEDAEETTYDILKVYMIRGGNAYDGYYKYFLSLYEKKRLTISDVTSVTEQQIADLKSAYKEIMGKEPSEEILIMSVEYIS